MADTVRDSSERVVVFQIVDMRCVTRIQSTTAKQQRQKRMVGKGKVVVTPLVDDAVTTIEDASLWPDGNELLSFIKRAKENYFDDDSHAHRRDGEERETSFVSILNPSYWQAAARLALLKKYGTDFLLPSQAPTIAKPSYSAEGKPRILLTRDDIDTISHRWHSIQKIEKTKISEPAKNAAAENSNVGTSSTATISHDNSKSNPDLAEFVSTCKSNERRLQWSSMECGPACQFQLHAHPNIELVYCIQGALHEVRMDGPPLRDEVARESRERQAAVQDGNAKLVGPDLLSLKRSWSFGTLSAGQWLVNEVGSIHKSFTATSSDENCILLVLWGGSHANIDNDHEPTGMDITKTVQEVDEQLRTMQQTTGTCECIRNPVLLPDSFIPK